MKVDDMQSYTITLNSLPRILKHHFYIIGVYLVEVESTIIILCLSWTFSECE